MDSELLGLAQLPKRNSLSLCSTIFVQLSYCSWCCTVLMQAELHLQSSLFTTAEWAEKLTDNHSASSIYNFMSLTSSMMHTVRICLSLSTCLSVCVCSFGIRFPCMSDAYSKDLRRLALDVGSELGCSDFIREGVYCMVSGPNFETIAEARMLLILGCDSVGKTVGCRQTDSH